jgi:hypothetical protein
MNIHAPPIRRDERGGNLTLPVFPRVALRVRLLGVIGLLAAVLPACVKHLPPAPTPDAVAPALALDAAPPLDSGHARLVVDVVEGPTRVQRIRMQSEPIDNGDGRVSYRLFESPEVLCEASPCVVDVPAGNLLLGFPVLGDRGATEVELVHVGPDPSVYRRSLSVYRGNGGAVKVLGIIGTSLGGASAITGMALLPIGLAKDNDDLATAGAITLGAGAVLIVAGIWALRHEAATYRPGSSNHFPLYTPTAP